MNLGDFTAAVRRTMASRPDTRSEDRTRREIQAGAAASDGLLHRVATMEERMNTQREGIEMARTRADGETRAALERLRAGMADFSATLADRHAPPRWRQTAILSGVIAAAGGIVTAIILAAVH